MLGIHAPQLASQNGVVHRFFGRQGGVSKGPFASLNISDSVGDLPQNVLQNQLRICEELQFQPSQLFMLKQVHGHRIIQVKKADDPFQIAQMEADACWTDQPGVLLGIKTADCVPILCALRGGGAVAAIHAGWRGLALGIVEQTMVSLCNTLLVSPGDMFCAIGPCIGPSQFEVGSEVLQYLKISSEDPAVVVCGDKFRLDLSRLVESRLRAIGITSVEQIDHCTVLQSDMYFSHRGQQGCAGRQLSAIGMRQ